MQCDNPACPWWADAVPAAAVFDESSVCPREPLAPRVSAPSGHKRLPRRSRSVGARSIASDIRATNLVSNVNTRLREACEVPSPAPPICDFTFSLDLGAPWDRSDLTGCTSAHRDRPSSHLNTRAAADHLPWAGHIATPHAGAGRVRLFQAGIDDPVQQSS